MVNCPAGLIKEEAVYCWCCAPTWFLIAMFPGKATDLHAITQRTDRVVTHRGSLGSRLASCSSGSSKALQKRNRLKADKTDRHFYFDIEFLQLQSESVFEEAVLKLLQLHIKIQVKCFREIPLNG